MKKVLIAVALCLFAGLCAANESEKKVAAAANERWLVGGLSAEGKSLTEGYAEFEKRRQALNQLGESLEKRRKALEASWDEVTAPIISRVIAAGIPKKPGQILILEPPSASFPNGAFFFADPAPEPPAPVTSR